MLIKGIKITNQLYPHSGLYYWSIKSSEVLIHPREQINLENSVLSPRSQSQRTTYWMIPWIWTLWIKLIRTDRKQISGCRWWGSWGVVKAKRGVYFLIRVRKGSEIDCGDGCRTPNMLRAIELYTINAWIVGDSINTSVKRLCVWFFFFRGKNYKTTATKQNNPSLEPNMLNHSKRLEAMFGLSSLACGYRN